MHEQLAFASCFHMKEGFCERHVWIPVYTTEQVTINIPQRHVTVYHDPILYQNIALLTIVINGCTTTSY